MGIKDLQTALVNLQQEEDAYGLEIINIEATRTKVTVSVNDNPLVPQAVFAVMQCFITCGVTNAEWESSDSGVDLVATFS